MVLDTPKGPLHGTLHLPRGNAPFAIALIIAGSGPTDRDGNSTLIPGRNDALKLVAEALAEVGVASLRYDKRGIGESASPTFDEAELTFDGYVDDAVAWLRELGTDGRFDRSLVIGHSEGSLIGMLAASRAAAAAFVSLAGVGRPAAAVIHSQLEGQLPPELLAEVDQVLAELAAGRTVSELPAGIAGVPAIGQALLRASVQPYLVSWFRFDPSAAIAALDVPTLIVQGTTDLQVPVSDAAALHAAARRGALALIEGMNHVLKLAPADPEANLAVYGEPDVPLAPALVEALQGFVTTALDR